MDMAIGVAGRLAAGGSQLRTTTATGDLLVCRRVAFCDLSWEEPVAHDALAPAGRSVRRS